MDQSGRIETAPGNPHVVRVIAPNPSPMTLGGTNTYLVVEEESVWVVDPGPRNDVHLDAVRSEAEARGGIRGVVLTHSHSDHSEAAHSLDAPVVVGEAGSGDEAQVFAAPAETELDSARPADENARGSAAGTMVGSMEVVPTPGHAHDHVVLVAGAVCLCGDLVLGEGSSIVPPRSHGGSLSAYLQSLERLAALKGVEVLAPGHGPWITDPAAKISQYIAHRAEREQKLVAALEAGEREPKRLLDLAWHDVPALMRPAAAIALQAHLEKLADEGRLPDDMRPNGQ